ncbi:MAG: helix-turn-helix domain-containing protein [Phycisphaerae bacterium]
MIALSAGSSVCVTSATLDHPVLTRFAPPESQQASPGSAPREAAGGSGSPSNILFVHAYLRQIREAGWLARWTGPQRTLILAYLSFADRRGVAYPGLTLLAQATGMSQRNVQRTRQTLVLEGYLVSVTQSAGRIAKLWRLVLPSAAVDSVPTPAPDAVVESVNPGAAGSPTPAHRDTQPRRSRVANHGAGRRPNSIEQTKEQTMNNTGCAGGGAGGGFYKKPDADRPLVPPRTDSALLDYLISLGIHATKAVRAGLHEHEWTLEELQTKWRQIVNAWPPGDRHGPLAAAIAQGERCVERREMA